MLTNYFITIATFVAIANADNIGWKSYFVENPTEFHDIPLSWESGNQTSVPSWLSGVYVRNGPAQVTNFFIIFIHQNLKRKSIMQSFTPMTFSRRNICFCMLLQ
jgi:hypothetical protein